jgi:hypothetical protein
MKVHKQFTSRSHACNTRTLHYVQATMDILPLIGLFFGITLLGFGFSQARTLIR